jgi:glycosyltransferase involved in cell wall biosynthesis
MTNSRESTILSIHTGLGGLGGVTGFVRVLNRVQECAPLRIRYLTFQHDAYGHYDQALLDDLDACALSYSGPWDVVECMRSMRAHVASVRPDLVLVHGVKEPLIYGLCRLLYRDATPFACTYHGEYHAPTPWRLPLRWAYHSGGFYMMAKHAVGVLAVAEFCRDQLTSRGVPAAKVTVVHNGLKAERPPRRPRNEMRGAWGVPEDAFVFGAASRLDACKGLNYLIRAFAMIAQQVTNAWLVVAGDGKARGHLEGLTRRLGLADRVRFLGYQRDVESCLDAFDVFVLPSLFEYHSIALLEAMRAALPIVATDVGGNTESVRDGLEASIVHSAEADSLAAALLRIAQDASLRDTLATAARKRFLAIFTEERTVSRTAEWLNDCLRKARGTRGR